MKSTMLPKTRIDARLAALAAEGRAALVTFVTAGDPDMATSLEILRALPEAGADIVEFGMPFSDPMAEGPPIQAADLRALAGGQTMVRTLDMVRAFRQGDDRTPIVLMGYYNPIYAYGVDRFLVDAKAAGVDGLIVVDLPPEEDDELCVPAIHAGISFIRLATPTSDDRRLDTLVRNTSGFIYYVSVLGVTGVKSAAATDVAEAVARIHRHSDLPVMVGFGVKTGAQAKAIAAHAEGVVVGSAIVNAVRDSLEDGKATERTIPAVKALVADLARGVAAAKD